MRMRRLKNFDRRLSDVSDILTMYQIDVKNHNAKVESDYIDFSSIFGNDNPVYLEVGCGLGGFATEYANRNKDINILAVEVNDSVVIKAAERTKKRGVDNLHYLCVSANYLNRIIEDKSVDRIFLNFSCPYPKNRYESHRLTSPAFLEIYSRLLKKGARIHQKTDNMHFFEYSIEQYSKFGYKLENISLDLHNSDFEGNIVTEYEAKFLAKGQPIYRLEAYLD